MAEELGVTLTSSAVPPKSSPPPARGMRPSPEQRDTARRALASILSVSLDRLDTVRWARVAHLATEGPFPKVTLG